MKELFSRVFKVEGLDGLKTFIGMLAMFLALQVHAFRQTFMEFPQYPVLDQVAGYVDYALAAVQWAAAGLGSVLAPAGLFDKLRKALNIK